MYKDNKTNDFKFIDRTIAEMFITGGTGVGLHKYLGPIDQGVTNDATQPSYANSSPTNIQDILFLENRDRKYDPDVFVMRGVYQRSDNDFDLSQFGLFLQNGTIMMTFHLTTMISNVGRRIMAGDVVELFHLRDDYALDSESALKRFYVASDCSFATEGFSPTWYPHLWRVKFNPLVDSQEYKDITTRIKATNTLGPMGTDTSTSPLVDIISTYNKYISINEAIVTQAEADVPKSGYDVSKIYSPMSDGQGNIADNALSADSVNITADSRISADEGSYSPTVAQNPIGYLSGDGLAPNGMAVHAGVSFSVNPSQGDYCLRLDYLPNRLFRFDGSRWVKIEDNVRAELTNGAVNNTTLRSGFVNNAKTITLSNGDVIPEKQTLSQVLRPKADY